MRNYKDKNFNTIKEGDFVLVESDKVCQALRCDDGTLLYEDIKLTFNKDDTELDDNPNYPDAYSNDEIEIISKDKAIKLLIRQQQFLK